MDNVVDKIQIEFESASKSTADSFSSLKNSLRQLDKLGQSPGLSKLYNLLKRFSTLDFTNVSDALGSIEKSLSAVAKKKITIAPEVKPIAPISADNIFGNKPPAIEELNQTVDIITDSSKSVMVLDDSVSELKNTFADIADPIERTKMRMDILRQQITNTTEEFVKASEKFGDTDKRTLSLQNKVITLTNSYDNLNKSLEKLESNKATAGLADEMEKVNESVKKTNQRFNNFFKSVKRIATYRLIRTMLREITGKAVTGLQNIALHSKEVNQTMSNLNTASVAISNAIGVTLATGLKAIEPLLMGMADVLVTVLNSFNALMAAMSGSKTYTRVMTATEAATKANQAYTKSIKEAKGALFSFDKFESMSKGAETTAPLALFSTEQVDSPFQEFGKGIGSFVKQLGDANTESVILLGTLGTIAAIKLGTWVSGAVTAFGAYVVGTDFATSATLGLNTSLMLLRTTGIFLIITSIADLVNNWDTLSGSAKALDIILIALGTTMLFLPKKAIVAFIGGIQTMIVQMKLATAAQRAMSLGLGALGAAIAFVGLSAWFDSLDEDSRKLAATITLIVAALAAATVAWLAFHGTMTAGVAVPIILTAVGAGVAAITALMTKNTMFAQGGIPERDIAKGGSLFSLNEFGKPELMYENANRQVEISNQQSLKDSFYAALTEWGSEQSAGGTESRDIVLEVNGREFARRTYSDFEAEGLRRGKR